MENKDNGIKTQGDADFGGMRLYTLTEIEPLIGVSHRTLLDYVKYGRLKGVIKIGGKWKISEDNLRRFIDGEMDRSDPEPPPRRPKKNK